MNTPKRMLIVSNRLPVKMIQKEGGISYRNSEGGLATGLGSIYKEDGNLWIGWPGDIVADKDKDKNKNKKDDKKKEKIKDKKQKDKKKDKKKAKKKSKNKSS